MADDITQTAEKLTDLTGIETVDELENAVFETMTGFEIGIDEIEKAHRAGVDMLSGEAVVADAQIQLEATPLDVMGKTHSFSDFVMMIERGDYTFVRVEE